MTFALPMFGNFAAMVSIYAQDGTVAVSHVGIEMGQGVNTKVSLVGTDIGRNMNVWPGQLSQYSDWLRA
jgi:xanthine dehydrogenase molybdopterin-binding subunit B